MATFSSCLSDVLTPRFARLVSLAAALVVANAPKAAGQEGGLLRRALDCRGEMVHQQPLQDALASVAKMEPEQASEGLTYYFSRAEVEKHLGMSLLLAMRSQGLNPVDVAYCQSVGVRREKWIGVVADDGATFVLDLSGYVTTGRGVAFRAGKDGRTLAEASAPGLDGVASCGVGQTHVNGIFGQVLQKVAGERYSPWRHTASCEKILSASRVSGASVQKGPGLSVDAKRADRLAKSAYANRNNGFGRCYQFVYYALKAAGIPRPPKGTDYDSYFDQIKMGSGHAYQFAEWADSSPQTFLRLFGMRRMPTPADPTRVPRGSVVVYNRGTCGFSSTSGHIEVAQGDGTACSDHCQDFYPSCFSSEPSRIHVYVPVKR